MCLCCFDDSDVGDLLIVTILRCWWQKKYAGDIFLHVGDIPIGRQHHNMPECDVGDRYIMLETWSSTWFNHIQYNFFSICSQISRGLHRLPTSLYARMLVPNSWCWWRDLASTSVSCHQHIWFPTSVTNMDVTVRMVNGERKWTEALVS